MAPKIRRAIRDKPAARQEPSRSVTAEVLSMVSEQCGDADIRVAIGLGNATFVDGNVDGELLDAESWAPYPLVDGVWVDPQLR